MLTIPQATIATTDKRFRVVVAGRRFGKTFLAIRELCKWASEPNRQVWYIAPSYRQAKQIVWKELKEKLTSLNWIKKINESELTIYLVNNSIIALKGSDNRDSLRGVGLHGVVMDEFADQDQEVWTEVIRPTLSTTNGKGLFIGTPKGMNWAYELYNQATATEDWAAFSYTTADGGQVPAEELEAAKRDLDERTYRQEYEATWEEYAGRIYHSFSRVNNVKPFNRKLTNNDTLYLGIDMNVGQMSCVIGIIEKNQYLHIIDEIKLISSNTYELVAEIKARYPNNIIIAYPDPAGYQRKTNQQAGITDIAILSSHLDSVKAPKRHTSVRDRINAVNSRLLSYDKDTYLTIEPKCNTTITSLERQTYKEGTVVPDKDSGHDHMNDALGYLVDGMWPVRKEINNMDMMSPGSRSTGRLLG